MDRARVVGRCVPARSSLSSVRTPRARSWGRSATSCRAAASATGGPQAPPTEREQRRATRPASSGHLLRWRECRPRGYASETQQVLTGCGNPPSSRAPRPARPPARPRNGPGPRERTRSSPRPRPRRLRRRIDGALRRVGRPPATPRRSASRRVESRKKTPCTRPWATTRRRSKARRYRRQMTALEGELDACGGADAPPSADRAPERSARREAAARPCRAGQATLGQERSRRGRDRAHGAATPPYPPPRRCAPIPTWSPSASGCWSRRSSARWSS